ncbi:MAG: SGNH/GDSL hydrolase family protein [Proteobacteria bacterium]|nr:SGNH/GDSL hydrolase family protein [Pseudomonadota bacterium]
MRGWLLAAALLVCAADAGAAKEKPDSYDPGIVQGDWIKRSDILFVGDSESLGYFGAQLYRSLSREPDPKTGRPLTVWSFWTCGSDAGSWLNGGVSYCGIRTCNGAGDCARDHGPLDEPGRVHYAPLARYVAQVKPRVTLISLGSNMLTQKPRAFRNAYDAYLDTAARLARAVQTAGSQCIWIGPPQAALTTKPLADYERFTADLGRALRAAGCGYVDSNPLSDRKYVLARDPEGIHYQGAGERDWETRVWVQLRPLLLSKLAR